MLIKEIILFDCQLSSRGAICRERNTKGDVFRDYRQDVIVAILLLLLSLTCSVLVANPKKTTLHGGQSRSWIANQGKENNRKMSGSIPSTPPPPPTVSFGAKI